MKTNIRIFLIRTILIALFISYYLPLLACTSYAVYGNKIYYGMNFDYATVELKFTISVYDNRKVFQGLFFENGGWSAICGMNNSGVFSSMQMLYPQVTNWPAPKPNEITLYDAYISALAQCDSLQQALNYLEVSGAKVIHIPGLSLHDFFADKYGRAYALEPGTDHNLLTKVENNFIVMTNFPNSQFTGSPLNEISGAGADRYVNAYQYIQANKSTFNFDNGVETLRRTVQSSGSFLTQVSFVFDPGTNEVFIILKRDFTKIWKVSIDNGTIETYLGFNRYEKISLDSSGILASDLQRITTDVESDNMVKPESFLLKQNYPNPFNPETSMQYAIGSKQFVTLKVYDVLGKEVAVLVNETKEPGEYSIKFDASNLTSGIYIYRLTAGNYTGTKKMILLK